jgi:hypothetical protein
MERATQLPSTLSPPNADNVHYVKLRTVISKSHYTLILLPIALLPAVAVAVTVARAVSGARVSAAAQKGHDHHLTRTRLIPS